MHYKGINSHFKRATNFEKIDTYFFPVFIKNENLFTCLFGIYLFYLKCSYKTNT